MSLIPTKLDTTVVLTDDLRYSKDKTKDLSRDITFMKWYLQSIKDGYLPYMNLEEMKEMIETIKSWYLIKYPSQNLKESFIGEFEDDELTEAMNMEALMDRLKPHERALLTCTYRRGIKDCANEDTLYLMLPSKKKNMELEIRRTDGKIMNDISWITHIFPDGKDMTVDELYACLDGYGDYDLDDLRTCVTLHSTDKKLRQCLIGYIDVAIRLSDEKNQFASRTREEYWLKEIKAYCGAEVEISEYSAPFYQNGLATINSIKAQLLRHQITEETQKAKREHF